MQFTSTTTIVLVMSRPEDELVAWRKEQESGCLSQKAAGLRINPAVTQAAWGAWETGRKPPGLHNAFEIERITGGRILASSWSRPHSKQRAKARAARPPTKTPAPVAKAS